MGLSNEEIINSETQNILIAIGGRISESKFDIGDIAAARIEEALARDEDVTRNDVYRAVAYYAQVQPRTVRYYTEVSQSFDEATRTQFSGLSFSHFATANKRKYTGIRIEYLLHASDNNQSPDHAERDFDRVYFERTGVWLGDGEIPAAHAGANRRTLRDSVLTAVRALSGASRLTYEERKRFVGIWWDLTQLARDIRSRGKH